MKRMNFFSSIQTKYDEYTLLTWSDLVLVDLAWYETNQRNFVKIMQKMSKVDGVQGVYVLLILF